MKYVFMHEHSGEFKVVSLCRVLGVSRSGFYRWQQRGKHPTIRQQQRMVLDLRDQGHDFDRKTVAASMKRQNLRAKAARKYKATTNSNHNLPVAPNLLQQNFSA